MTFKKKLLLAGLAIGISTYMLYKASKKREKERQQQRIQQGSGGAGHNYAAMGAGVAAVGAAGYAAHQYNQSHQAVAPPPEETGSTTWSDLKVSSRVKKTNEGLLYRLIDIAPLNVP